MGMIGSNRPLARDNRRKRNEMNLIQQLEAEQIAKLTEKRSIPQFRRRHAARGRARC